VGTRPIDAPGRTPVGPIPYDRRDDRRGGAVQQDQQGDSVRRGATGTDRRVGRRRLAGVVLGVVIVTAVGMSAFWSSDSGAQATAHHRTPGRRASLSRAIPTRAVAHDPSVAPPPTATPWAPGSLVAGGGDQSDPFLTVASGHYLLFTSGGTGPAPINVPVVTSTDFVHWTAPIDAMPTLPEWAQPGYTWAPDLHRFGTLYALYFTAMVKGVVPPTECIGSAFSPSATGPFTAQPDPMICQLDQGGSIDPRVFTDPEGRNWMVWKSDQNIGGSDTPTKMWSQRLSSDGTTLLASPSFLMSPDRSWQGTIVEAPDMFSVDGAYWLVYSANWYNQPEYAVGAARCAGPSGPCQDVTPGPLLASNFQGEGPGEASVFRDRVGIWLLYSPRRSLAPQPDIPPRPVFIVRLGVVSSGPYLASGPPPGAVDLLGVPLWSSVS